MNDICSEVMSRIDVIHLFLSGLFSATNNQKEILIMRKEKFLTTVSTKQNENGGMMVKKRFAEVKKKLVPAVSGSMMAVMLMSSTCFAAGAGTSAVTQPLENLKTLIIAVIGAVDILMAQPEDEAKDIALSLELFVNGTYQVWLGGDSV